MRKILVLTLVLLCAFIFFYLYLPNLFQEKGEVTLYFIIMTETDFLLYPVTRTVNITPNTEDLYRATLELLIKGPLKGEDAGPVLPDNVLIRDLKVEGDLITIDFSREIKKLNVGARGEQITIYSIVNTLTEFPGINEVQLLIEGERGVSLAGHFMLMEPFSRSEEVIYRE